MLPTLISNSVLTFCFSSFNILILLLRASVSFRIFFSFFSNCSMWFFASKRFFSTIANLITMISLSLTADWCSFCNKIFSPSNMFFSLINNFIKSSFCSDVFTKNVYLLLISLI
uniref:(northern house mosquito) hypothetical protein n=1 Tax=Culex pipiens TaxID=7175 RepID=A0A8D8AUK9_CULPI